jgi:predicted NBD/HSP70 family sugar kinase
MVSWLKNQLTKIIVGLYMKRTKKINQARIMREIWVNKKTTRINIARALSLDKSTVSGVVNELIEKEMILEKDEGDSGPHGGRKPVHITINKKFGCVLGIEFRPEFYSAVVLDMEGNIIFSKTKEISFRKEHISTVFNQSISNLIEELHETFPQLLGVGVGISGVVNPEKGVIHYSKPLGITDGYDFYHEVSANYDIPIFVENDANACIWGELAFHRRKELRDFMFLLLEFRDIDEQIVDGTNRISVGMGFVINGNVHYGHQFSAGEFRSVNYKENSIGQFSLTSEEHLRLFEDPEVFDRFLHELGAHVGLILNTFNLSHIILGGAFERLGDHVKDVFEEEIRKNWPYPYPYIVRDSIWYSAFGEQAVAYGASGMVLNALFGDFEIMEGLRFTRNVKNNLVVFS